MENSNRELFSTNSEFLKKLYSNILLIAAVEYLIYNEGLNLKYRAQFAFNPFASFIGDEFSDLYNHFFWILIPLIPLVFIQCSAEEMLLRGYVPAVLGEKHSWDVVCFVSGILFIF